MATSRGSPTAYFRYNKSRYVVYFLLLCRQIRRVFKDQFPRKKPSVPASTVPGLLWQDYSRFLWPTHSTLWHSATCGPRMRALAQAAAASVSCLEQDFHVALLLEHAENGRRGTAVSCSSYIHQALLCALRTNINSLLCYLHRVPTVVELITEWRTNT